MPSLDAELLHSHSGRLLTEPRRGHLPGLQQARQEVPGPEMHEVPRLPQGDARWKNVWQEAPFL